MVKRVRDALLDVMNERDDNYMTAHMPIPEAIAYSRKTMILAARAAIAAMREPTPAMLKAGMGHGLDAEHAHVTSARWRAMIRAALGEDKP